MSIANEMGPVEEDTHAKKLRSDLKVWEEFFKTINGRKPGREDIKQHSDIAQKYKDYDKVRLRISSAAKLIPSTSPPTNPSKKRKRPSANLEHVSSTQQPASRSLRHSKHPSALDSYDEPLTHLTPNPPRTIIGPTPQKDGLVLGLFDLLSPKRTPSKTKTLSGTSHRSDPLATPSKDRLVASATTPGRSASSPQSMSKRLSLSKAPLGTPIARRTTLCTPTSFRTGVPRLTSDDTPEFLRRSAPLFPTSTAANTHTLEEQNAGGDKPSWSPVAVRLPRKPIGRSLSALVMGLRAMEEEKMDEELELLREMEGDDLGPSNATAKQPRTLIKDSQVEVEMPLGADGEGESSGEEEVARGMNGKPLRVWKKKGQKRSTRRVNMKPVVGKWKPEKEWACDEKEEDRKAEEDTQVQDGVMREDARLENDTSEKLTECNGNGDKGPTKGLETGEKYAKGDTAKPTKKISATAHANFRALKIKNKQSKGKRGGKFGRRR
ncbi:DNA replication regulator sld2 [Ptychographa xylographoides]|nr:DNA replication regulator sld2 [Ptychographa xylographoides]